MVNIQNVCLVCGKTGVFPSKWGTFWEVIPEQLRSYGSFVVCKDCEGGGSR